MTAYRVRGLLEKDYLTFLAIIGEYLEAAEGPVEQRLSLGRIVEIQIANVPNSSIVTRTMMPSVRPTWEVDLAGIARLRACVTALAVERYRLAKGKLPDGLGDLVGEYLESVPADPFTGQMLKYKKLQQGYVVYSVGKDGKDDGGVEQEGLILFLRLGSEGKDAQSALDIHYLTYMGGKLSGFLPSHK